MSHKTIAAKTAKIKWIGELCVSLWIKAIYAKIPADLRVKIETKYPNGEFQKESYKDALTQLRKMGVIFISPEETTPSDIDSICEECGVASIFDLTDAMIEKWFRAEFDLPKIKSVSFDGMEYPFKKESKNIQLLQMQDFYNLYPN